MKTTNYYLVLSTAVLVGVLVYGCKTGTPGDAVKTAMEKEIIKEKAEVYIAAFRKNNHDYRAKYSKEGDIIDLNHLVNVSVLPKASLDVLKKGEYKDWEMVGDVFEILDIVSNEPTGSSVKIQKAEQKERLFFDLEGNIVKIQKISK